MDQELLGDPGRRRCFERAIFQTASSKPRGLGPRGNVLVRIAVDGRPSNGRIDTGLLRPRQRDLLGRSVTTQRLWTSEMVCVAQRLGVAVTAAHVQVEVEVLPLQEVQAPGTTI